MKYEEMKMEVVRFEQQDVITNSDPAGGGGSTNL